MRRLVNIAGGLLGLLALGALVVALALTFGGLQKEAKPVSQVFQSPIETPTQPPYPPPATPTRPLTPTIPPTVTRPPKPSPSPSPIPTATPVPTPLPLPPSAFYALWVENFPEGEGSVLWLADPGNIGSRKEVMRFEKQHVVETALSPNGRQMALVTYWMNTSTLWAVHTDGSNLQQLDQSQRINELHWSRDGQQLAYGITWREVETTTATPLPTGKRGGSIPREVVHKAFVLIDISTRTKRRLLEIPGDTTTMILGWSADGRQLYYIHPVGSGKIALRSVTLTGVIKDVITSLESMSIPSLSPDGNSLILVNLRGMAVFSLVDKVQYPIVRVPSNNLCGHVWHSNGKRVIICQVDEQHPREYVESIDIPSLGKNRLGVIRIPPGHNTLNMLSISPDGKWASTHAYLQGLYLVHLSTGTIVPIPGRDGWTSFAGWVSKTALGK